MILINIAHAGVISDAPKLSQAGLNILNFLLSVAGILAIMSLVASGILYLVSGGNEKRLEQAKKSFQYSIIGVVVIFAAWISIKTIGRFIQ